MNTLSRTFVFLCLAGLAAGQSLQISSPANGTVVNPGQSLTVNVSASGTFQQVMVIGWDPIGFSQEMLSTPPYQFTVQVPSTITPGQYTLTAFGVSSSNQMVNSDPISIDVERPDNPVSIAVEPTVLNLYPGQMGYLRVVGTFADGTSNELTASTATTFSSSAPSVATVNAQGIVTPVGPGSAQIIVAGAVSVSVTVAPQISITPPQATLTGYQRRSFVAFVANPANPAVTWSLNPGYGTVDANGNYTAPVAVPSQETDVLTATSVADNTQTASAMTPILNYLNAASNSTCSSSSGCVAPFYVLP